MSGIESLVRQGMQLGTRAFAEGGSTGMNDNESIKAYLQQMGVDPSLFGTYGANQLNALQRYDAGTGDYASWDYRPVSFDQYMQAIQSDPTNNQYTVGIGDRWSTVNDNYGVQIDPSTGTFGLRVKVGDKDSVEVPYMKMPDGSWAPNWQMAKAASWDTNAGNKRDIKGLATVLGAAAGSYFLGPAGAGAEVGTGSGAGAAYGIMDPALMAPGAFESAMGAGTVGAGEAALGGAAESMWPGLSQSMPGYAELVSGVPSTVTGSLEGGLGGMLGGFGDYMALAPEVAAGLQELELYGPPESAANPSSTELYGPPESAANSELYGPPESAANPTTQPYTPEAGPYAPGEAPGTINAPPAASKPFDWWEWVKTHPRELISGIGTIGSIIDDNTGSSGSGGSGGGGSGTGWNGPISNFMANQTYTPAPENYRPGFSPEHVYMQTSFTPGNPREPMMNQGVAAALPAPPPNIPPLDPYGGGYIAIDPSSAFPEDRAGIGALPKTKAVGFAGGGMTKGPGDGMSDHIPATIEGQQPAVLSAEEFVVPADVVSHLGNGSSEAGAKVLYAMMDRIRQARTGSKSQAREIDPAKFLP